MSNEMSGINEPREQRLKRHTTQQFEILGRFVQEFELMAEATRFGVLQLTAKNVLHQRLLNIVLHHKSMTAMPLMEILLAIIGEIMSDTTYNVLPTERDATLKIMRQMHKAYVTIVERRNELLHGTWYIGWAGFDGEDFSTMSVAKFKSIRKGFQAVEPPDIAEMSALIDKCREVAHMLRSLIISLTMPDGALQGTTRVTNNFKFENGGWATGIQRG